MKERREGLVSRVEGGFAFVVPEKMELCKECTLCERTRSNEIKTVNRAEAAIGDRVSFEIDLDSLNVRFIKFLAATLLLLLAGAVGGYLLGNALGGYGTPLSAAGAVAGLLLAFLIFRERRAPECNVNTVAVIKKEE